MKDSGRRGLNLTFLKLTLTFCKCGRVAVLGAYLGTMNDPAKS